MGKRSRISVGLSPALLEVRRDGQSRAVIDLDPSQWEDAWLKGLRPLDAALEQALRQAGVSGGAADVVYGSPDQRSEVFSLAASPDAARRAARLALADQFPGGLDGHPEAATVLRRDRGGTTHVLACADRDDAADAVRGWLMRCGLRLNALIPAPGAQIVDAVRTFDRLAGQGPIAIIDIASNATTLAAGRDGALEIVRTIAIGAETFAEAIFRTPRGNEATASLTRTSAREILLRVGIPGRDVVLHEGLGLRGKDVLPGLQPAIQRLVVEIRQTLRFGFGQSESARLRVVLSGLAGRISGLGELVSDALDLTVEIDQTDPERPIGLLADAEGAGTELGLLPRSEAIARRGRTIRSALAAGFALAAAVVGLESAAALHSLREARATYAQLSPALEQGRQLERTVERLRELAERAGNAEAALVTAVGPRADWAGALAELGSIGSPSVRLLEFDGEFEDARPIATLKGVAISLPGTREDPLRGYIEALMKSQLAETVRIGSTRLTEVDGNPATHFTLTTPMRGKSSLAGVLGSEVER